MGRFIGGFTNMGRKYGAEWWILIAGALIIGGIILMALLAPFIAPFDPHDQAAGPQLAPPSPDHLLGTDNLQRDVFSRIIFGARTILGVAILAAIISSVVGITLGMISGYSGGVFDKTLSLIMDSVYSFPGLILAIAFAAMLEPGIMSITIAVAVIYIPTYFRLVRGQTLTIKEELYVEAAQAIGAPNLTILIKYIFPNVIATTAVVFTMNVGDAIMIEAALTYLGLGLPPSVVDWGMDLSMGKKFLPSGQWWLITFPGLMISTLAVGFTMLGEGEISDPVTIIPGSQPDIVSDLRAERSDSEVLLSWTEPDDHGYDIEGYNIYLINGNGRVLAGSVDVETQSFLVDGLINGVRYGFQISAFNELGEGPSSMMVESTPLSVPGKVTDVWFRDPYRNNVIVHWLQPEDTGGLPVISYKIYRGTNDGELVSVGSVKDLLFFSDVDVEDGTEYFYSISAVTDFGEGPRSDTLSVTILGIPSPVRSLSTDATTDTVELSWLPPDDDGGIPVLGYLVYKGTDPVSLDLWKDVGPSTMKVTDKDVTDGTYYYRVVPYNAVGTGTPSTMEASVPSRLGVSILLGVVGFLVPLLLVILVVVLPLLIKRSRKKREERDAREAHERVPTTPVTSPSSPPKGPSLGSGRISSSMGVGGLPPVRQQYPGQGGPSSLPSSGQPTNQLPPRMDPVPDSFMVDGYIRPEMKKAPAFQDRNSVLRQDGRSIKDHMGPSQTVIGNDQVRSDDPAEKIGKLASLKEQGLISEEEFESNKKRILDDLRGV